MFGMDFMSFVILLVISVVVSLILHYALNYYVISGLNSFFSKVVIGWVGAWLGSPVFGHWFDGLRYENVYYVPATLGSLALLVLAVDIIQSLQGTTPEVAPAASPGETLPPAAS